MKKSPDDYYHIDTVSKTLLAIAFLQVWCPVHLLQNYSVDLTNSASPNSTSLEVSPLEAASPLALLVFLVHTKVTERVPMFWDHLGRFCDIIAASLETFTWAFKSSQHQSWSNWFSSPGQQESDSYTSAIKKLFATLRVLSFNNLSWICVTIPCTDP